MKRKSIFLALALLMALALVVPAFADATVTIVAGSLSQTPQNITFGTVTLTGADQTVPDQDVTAWTASDATGTGNGWHITIAATDFSDGTHTIGVANFRAQLLDANITTVMGNTPPASSITTFTPLSTVAQTLLSAATGNGMGEYQYIPDFTLDVAASTFAGSYLSTVTVAIVSGP